MENKGEEFKDDFKLLSDFTKGDEDSFNQILNRHKKPLINFIYRYTLNDTDAEDIAQEVFLKIYLNASKFKPNAKFSTILYKIAINLSIDFIRKKKRKMSIANIFSLDAWFHSKDGEINREFQDSSRNTPEAILELKEQSLSIERLLENLPENQRLAIVLKVYEKKNYKEIADIMNCSISSVESLLFRARQNLKNRIENKAENKPAF